MSPVAPKLCAPERRAVRSLPRVPRAPRARDLAVTLFDRANLLIKDLAGKAGIAKNREFFRVAVRSEEDDDILLNALNDYLRDQSK